MFNSSSLTNLFEMIGASFLLIFGLMTVLWFVYCIQRNAGIVDIGWGLAFILAAWAYALIGKGYFPRKWLITLFVTLWGSRLSWHIAQRYLSSREEDPRYAEIRKNWGSSHSDVKFLMMFLFQGFLVMILSLPILIVCRNESQLWSRYEFWGSVILLVGIIGETIADRQLELFKQDPDNRGQVFQNGLWKYSRHPNYFFEWVVWIGFAVFAFGSPGGSVGIISPILMLFLLVKISGIPLSEEQALRSKGAAYEEYQRKTNSFFPWFKI